MYDRKSRISRIQHLRCLRDLRDLRSYISTPYPFNNVIPSAAEYPFYPFSSPFIKRGGRVGSFLPIYTMTLLCDYYDITMLFKALRNTLTKTV